MKAGSPAAARRYARALLDVALAGGSAELLRRELDELRALLDGQRELAGLLIHPALAVQRKQKLVAALLQGRVSPLAQRLLELLVERNRIALLPGIAQGFTALWNAHRKVLAAEAVSAVPLDASQQAALAGAIEKARGVKTEVISRVDPGLLGGIRLQLGGLVYDGSVRTRLRALRERLTAGASHA